MTEIARPVQPSPVEDDGTTAAGVFSAADHQEILEVAHNHADHLEAHAERLSQINNVDSILDFIAALDAALT